MTDDVDRLLAEQIRYYDDRAPEYEDLWFRRGRYDRGPEADATWFVGRALPVLDRAAPLTIVRERGRP